MRRTDDAGNVVVLQIPSELLTHGFFEANEADVIHGYRYPYPLPGPL
jgi:hypothetical protein